MWHAGLERKSRSPLPTAIYVARMGRRRLVTRKEDAGDCLHILRYEWNHLKTSCHRKHLSPGPHRTVIHRACVGPLHPFRSRVTVNADFAISFYLYPATDTRLILGRVSWGVTINWALWHRINLLKPNVIYICRCSANLQTLHFKYLFNKYTYWIF